jgi:hypothetical protein
MVTRLLAKLRNGSGFRCSLQAVCFADEDRCQPFLRTSNQDVFTEARESPVKLCLKSLQKNAHSWRLCGVFASLGPIPSYAFRGSGTCSTHSQHAG